MNDFVLGLVHLLDRDFTAVCGCEFGWLSGSLARCTCPSCLAVWQQAKEQRGSRPLVTDDSGPSFGH